jgi:hypothetical protein
MANLDSPPRRVRLSPSAPHGELAGVDLFDWQRDYIERLLEAVRSADWTDPETAKAHAVAAIDSYLAQPELHFLMELSLEPVAAELGLIQSGDSPS